jgi:hypothetical protein
MTTSSELLIQDVESLHEALSDYTSLLAQYLFTATGNPPHFDTLAENIKYLELVTIANQNINSFQGLSAGILTKLLYKTVATIREKNMSGNTKAAIYVRAATELGAVKEELAGETAVARSYFSGTAPDQNIIS